ncbi:uncharacterized protein LOC112690761 [Sipha flava]|uniref:Gustatory receptor n=1 Tax=Sipha flava TaxID=143950 RepID=A0A8B8GCU7_9HEMI|nr:uncharacterized protein LOC112690761 [Sipha flava]
MLAVAYSYLLKYWCIIIAARSSEKWIIRLINGIIEYDQKVEFFFKSTSTHHRSQSQTYWNTVFIVLITYYVITTVIIWIFHPPQSMNVLVFFTYIFQLQYFIDFTIVTSTYFFLTNLEFRFQMLNNLWKLYPIEIFTIPGGWTCSKITMFLEDIRLLHAELSELLKIFSVGYGKMLLGFFVFSYIDILFLYFLLIHLSLDEQGSISVTVTVLITSGLGKTIAFIMSIILATSRVNKELYYLRLIRISVLPVIIKQQIKMFMNQILVFESYEMTAFGVFRINMNLSITFLLLIMTGMITVIQMKNHPFSLLLFNDFTTFWDSIFT